jgi:hypothetical protein
MLNWYQTKDSEREIVHSGVRVQKGQYLYLSKEQAALHGGAMQEAKNPPTSVEECAVKEEFEAFKNSKKSETKDKLNG